MNPTEVYRSKGAAVASEPSSVSARSVNDPAVIQALQEYRAAREAGQKPSRQQLLARFPEIAGELSACLEALDFVHAAASQLHSERAAAGADLPAEIPATPLGDFRLLREVGRGGMGVVYEAEQLSLGRRVALKVLPFAAGMDARQLQRFKNEAHAAANLHHTHIVPVYAVGCERGVHYYAMQFIEGHTLAEVIDLLRRPAGQGQVADPGGQFARGPVLLEPGQPRLQQPAVGAGEVGEGGIVNRHGWAPPRLHSSLSSQRWQDLSPAFEGRVCLFHPSRSRYHEAADSSSGG
jgi:hypothetical protein